MAIHQQCFLDFKKSLENCGLVQLSLIVPSKCSLKIYSNGWIITMIPPTVGGYFETKGNPTVHFIKLIQPKAHTHRHRPSLSAAMHVVVWCSCKQLRGNVTTCSNGGEGRFILYQSACLKDATKRIFFVKLICAWVCPSRIKSIVGFMFCIYLIMRFFDFFLTLVVFVELLVSLTENRFYLPPFPTLNISCEVLYV